MATTPKYDLDLTDYGTVGWNVILQGSIEDLDDFLNTRIAGSCGATINVNDVVYLDASGKYSPAQGVAGKMPAAGIALNAGNADDDILVQRIGPAAAFSSGMTPGEKMYVSAGTEGSFTQTKPGAFSQAIGRALSATALFVWVEDVIPIHYGTGDPPTPTGYPDGTIYFKHA